MSLARVGWVLVVVAMCVVGCGPKETSSLKTDVPKEVPQGWREYESASAKFTVATPPHWVPLSELTPMENMGGAASDPDALGNISNPAVGYGLAPAKEASSAGAALLVVNRQVRMLPGEPRTQMTVKHVKVGGGTSLKAMAAEHKGGIRGVGDAGRTMVELPIGQAAQSVGSHKTIAGDEVFEMQYVLVNKEDVYIVRFITTGQVSQIEQDALPIMQTFRLKN